MAELIGAVDQGTTSTRFVVLAADGEVLGAHQLEHEQILPRAGWVEHDPMEIWERTRTVVAGGLRRAGVTAADLAAIGVTNQRETTIVWDRRTGEPLHNAVVWQDTRADRIVQALERDGHGELIRQRTGLLPSAYFSGGKLRWLLAEVDGLRERAERGEVLFGTPDTWLVWNLTGGVDGGLHVTDVTNASRTMLMDLRAEEWDDELLELFGVPRAMLPRILPSSDAEGYGVCDPAGPAGGPVPITAVLGDQQAATVGQVCFSPGDAKCTYGTGSFLVLNTGTTPQRSTSGLLTTPAYRMGAQPTVYALEGAVAVTGAAVQWLRDQMGLIDDAAETEALAASVDDAGGCYVVPAFSGLFAPHWRPDARGVVVGLSRYHRREHVVRATLEAICYQIRDVAEAMRADSGIGLDVLRADGGAAVNDGLMQLQADVLGVPVSRPANLETTALGAAYAAGLAVGVWGGLDELAAAWREDRRFEPTWDDHRRERAYAGWQRAVQRSLDWVEVDREG